MTNKPTYFDTCLALEYFYTYEIPKVGHDQLVVIIYIEFVEFKTTWSDNPKQAIFMETIKRNNKSK